MARNGNRRISALLGLLALFLWSCSNGGGGNASSSAVQAGDADLVSVKSGRLVDVYGFGFVKDDNGRPVDRDGKPILSRNEESRLRQIIVLVERDVVVGTDIVDDALAGKPIEDVVYRFIASDPDTGQEKLLIVPNMEVLGDQGVCSPNPKFTKAYNSLDDNLEKLGSNYYSQDTLSKPFPVAPRNGGIRLKFSKNLGLPSGFFQRGGGVRNSKAVQLLEIQGDPTQTYTLKTFKVIPTRIIYKGDSIVLDPVILGREGIDYNLPNNAEGLPGSLNDTASNIRIALPLEGAVRINGLRETSTSLIAYDAYDKKAVIRDFRSGNSNSNNSSVSRGFINDAIAPRIKGKQVISILSRKQTSTGLILEIYQEAMKHTQKYSTAGDQDYYSPVELDIFDVISQEQEIETGEKDPKTGKPKTVKEILTAEIIADPIKTVFRDGKGNPVLDKFGQPKVHYKIQVARRDRLYQKYPKKNIELKPGNAIQTTVFEAQTAKMDKNKNRFVLDKDDPRYFLSFSPAAPDPKYPTDNISPFASVIVRFTKPVDMNTISAFDSLVLSIDDSVATVLDPQKGIPGLVCSRVYDQEGTRQAIRSQPPLGFYHDILHSVKGTTKKGGWNPAKYRRTGSDPALDPADLFYLYLITGKKGIKDLSGNSIDIGTVAGGRSIDSFRVDFTIMAEAKTNRIANICRRFNAMDEDPNIDNANSDAFGAAIFLADGKVMGRPTARFSSYVDNLNQMPEPSDPAQKFCPPGTRGTPTGSVVFSSPVQNPLNPMGCRQQSVWREIDLSLSRLDPFDFNLDVEAMWWAPFRSIPVSYDIFDKISLYVNTAERRPSPCVGLGSSLPYYSNSGLTTVFKNNYIDSSDPVKAFESKKVMIKKDMAVLEPHKLNRFMPFPAFDKPYLVFRNERDLRCGGGSTEPVISPFRTIGDSKLSGPNFNGTPTNGLPTIALPLLADFFVFPDDPKENGKCRGYNGWQIALAIQSSPMPYFRVYSAGGYKYPGVPNPPQHNGGPPVYIDPSTQTNATGGFTPSGGVTRSGDNSVYWIRVDFAKRMSVLTYGFAKFLDPNDCQYWRQHPDKRLKDPRVVSFGKGMTAAPRPAMFETVFEPPLSTLPLGTQIIPEFRGCQSEGSGLKSGFMLDSLAAAEAHVFPTSGYFMGCSNYYENPNDLFDKKVLKSPSGTPMDPSSLNYFNWRLVFVNNMNIDPPVTPKINSMGIVYRFNK